MNKKKKNTLILEAAFELFSGNGYKNTKIADIAAKAGIGKGTVYEYYESKEDIFISSIVETIIEDYSVTSQKVTEHASTLDKLRFFLDFEMSIFSKYGADASDLKTHLIESHPHMSDKMRNALSAVLVAEYEIISDIIREGIASGEIRNIDVALLANFIISSIASFFLLKYNLHPCSCTPNGANDVNLEENNLDSLLDFIFNGIANR
ncbi:MAG: TetR/AcrR family transcriptional regulator [Eubacteriales bacterium]|nr:TetR/AcrR family transcriptional regulator [Eubacteriales bacterium]MDD4389188.1 TetR/AcrR family transcriptional regulator [Eubacteriales bacterium]